MGKVKNNNIVALITGGSRGIGKQIALTLAKSGYLVAFTYKSDKKSALDVQKQIDTFGGIAKFFQNDIEDRNSIKTNIQNAQDFFNSPIQILINNAAIAQEKPFETITDNDWEKMLKVNLQGPFKCTQELLPIMIKNKWGRIINITSIGGQWGGFNQVHYAASKSALINFTQSIAKIYSKEGITSNAVSIGLANTDMSKPELSTDEGKTKTRSIPIGRVATLDEIANTVKFLCSNEASYITGQTINVNGGMYFG